MSSAAVVAGAIGLRAQNQRGEGMLTTSPTMSARGETEWSRCYFGLCVAVGEDVSLTAVGRVG